MGRITMVTSGRDGVGKTISSVLLADALAERGARVLVVELDSQLRSIDVAAGITGVTVFDLLDLLSGRCPTEKAIIRAPSPRSGVWVLCAPYRADVIDPELFLRLCTVLSEQFDHLLIDTSTLCPAAKAACTIAMGALLFATADPVGVRDARILYEHLSDMSVPDIRLVLSRVVPSRVGGDIVPHLDYCIDSIGARLIGVIPESDQIALSAATGQPLPAKSVERRVFQNIATRLLGADAPMALR